MSTDGDVVIRISAKNLTKEGFDAARKELGALQKQVGETGTATTTFSGALKDSTAKAFGAGLSFKDMASSLTGALLPALGVGAVVGFAKSVFDAASQIGDMAQQLGISTDAVQGFKFAAEQSGSTLEAVGTALTKMNQHLAAGDTSTIAALNAAGLSFDVIRAMKPEDAFRAIADGIATIPDPMEQTRVALELLGKGAAELLPAMKDGFGRVADGATKMSADTIHALKDAEDMWKRFGTNLLVFSGELFGGLAADAKRWASALKLDEVSRDLQNIAHFFNQFGSSVMKASDVKPPVLLTGAGAKQIQSTKDALALLTTGLDTQVVSVKKLDEAEKKATAAAEAHAKAIQTLTDKYSGATLAKSVSDLAEAMSRLGKNADFKTLAGDIGKMFDEGAKLTPEMIRLGIAFGTIGPKIVPIGSAFKDVGDQIAIVEPKIDAVWDKLNAPIPYGISHLREEFAALASVTAPVPPKIKVIHDGLDDLAKSLTQLAQIGGTAFGPLLQGAAQIVVGLKEAQKANDEFNGSAGVASAMFDKEASASAKTASAMATGATIVQGAMSVWASSANDGTKAAGAFHGAMSGAKAGAMFGPYGMAVGAAAGAILGMIHTLSAGRRAVEDFAKSFDTIAAGTGFDEMHAKLLVLGDAGEQLWISLTQKTKKGDKAGAQIVIEQITAALAAQDTQAGALVATMEKYGISWEEAGGKAKQAHIDEIGQGLITDFKTLAAGGIDIDTIIGKMGTSVNDFVLSAKRTGTEVPAAMRPMIEAMIENGTLIDENGAKITTLEGSGISFAESMTTGFKSLHDDLRDLIDLFGDKLPAAMAKIPRTVVTDIYTRHHDDGGGDGGTTSQNEPHYATGGIAAGRQRAIVGEGGKKEIIGDVDFMARALAGALARNGGSLPRGAAMTGGSGDIIIHHQTVLDGRVIDARITRVARRAAQTGQLQPRVAAGRSY